MRKALTTLAFIMVALTTTMLTPRVAAGQCVGPEKVGKTLGLYEEDALGAGVVTGPFSGRVPIRKPPHLSMEDATPAQFDELVDCDGTTFVVYTRETSPAGRVLLWFSIAWVALLIGGAVGVAAGTAMARRRGARTD